MSFENVKKIWMNGKLVDFADAKISHLHARPSLRVRRLRGRALLRHGARTGDLPARRASRPPLLVREDLPHGDPVHDRPAPRGDARGRARERLQGLLHPAARLSRLRLARRQPVPEPGGRRDRLLRVGQVPRRRRARAGRRRLLLVLDAHRAEHDARDGEGHGELREQPAHQDGGHHERLPRGDRDGPQRAHLRGVRRESLPRLEGPPLHAAAVGLDAARASRASPSSSSPASSISRWKRRRSRAR